MKSLCSGNLPRNSAGYYLKEKLGIPENVIQDNEERQISRNM